MLRKLFKPLKIECAALVGAALLSSLQRTLRWERVGKSMAEQPLGQGKDAPYIIVTWHSRQLILPWLYFKEAPQVTTNPRGYALISRHADGRIIARAVSYFGIGSVDGSSSRGGATASQELIRKLQSGYNIAVTPDGPRGPNRKLKRGVIKIAQLTGALIYPVAYSADRLWQFRSWDRMILPKPFARVAYAVGAPHRVPPELSDEELASYTEAVEQSLNQVTDLVDGYAKNLGRPR